MAATIRFLIMVAFVFFLFVAVDARNSFVVVGDRNFSLSSLALVISLLSSLAIVIFLY